MGTIILILIILLILGALISVYEFLAANLALTIIGGIVVLCLILLIYSSSDAKKKATYYPVSLRKRANFSENEETLYFDTLLLLQDGIKSFTPHDLGALGIQTTSTYYKNLYDKGYYDRIAFGTYAINKINLQKLLDKYDEVIKKRIMWAESAPMHKSLAKDSIAQYKKDLVNVRIGKKEFIERSILDAYINE